MRRQARSGKRGHVYLVEGAGLYKIGSSNDPALRLSSLRAGSPVPLRLVCEISTEQHRVVESRLHEHFTDKCQRSDDMGREWFRLSPDDVAWIENAATWQRHDAGECAENIRHLTDEIVRLRDALEPAAGDGNGIENSTSPDSKTLLNPTQAAKIIGVSRPGFVKMYKRKEIKAEVVVGRQAFFAPAAVRALIKKRNGKKGSKK